MNNKLTRRGARNLTATLDRIASAVQSNPSLLGIDPKIASDFAYRCDLISDAVETTAVANFPKAAAEFPADEIGAVDPGPLVDGEVDGEDDLAGQFTQQDFSELTAVAEKLAKAASAMAASKGTVVEDHGFDLTK